MESRLEAYRAKKRKALEEKEQNERYWNLLTLAPLRQRVFGNANNQLGEENGEKSPTRVRDYDTLALEHCSD